MNQISESSKWSIWQYPEFTIDLLHSIVLQSDARHVASLRYSINSVMELMMTDRQKLVLALITIEIISY